MKNLIFIWLFLFSSFGISHAQDIAREKIINDLLFLTENFSAPAAQGAAFQGSAGWFSSAASLERWDFRVSVHANSLFIPEDKKSFEVVSSQLDTLVIKNSQRVIVPTAFGKASNIMFEGSYQNISFEFDAFPGINRDFVPHAFVQVGIGLPRDTELTIRAMPEMTIDDVKASTFGAGVKHNFNQYFRYNDPESIQLAVGLAYSRFNVDYRFDPVNIQIAVLQDVNVKANVFMAELIGSKSFGIFEIFGAAGVVSTTFDYEMGGEGQVGLGQINDELEKLGDVENLLKGDLGFNIHMGRFRLSAMGTVGKFFNANLGLHVRI